MSLKAFSYPLLFLCILTSGCMSARFTSTLKPSKDPQLCIGDLSFHIASPAQPHTSAFVPEVQNAQVQAATIDRYPRMFDQNFSALPIQHTVTISKIRTSSFSSFFGTFLSGIGVLPIPGWTEWDLHVKVDVLTPDGCLALGETDFTRRDSMWLTLWTPLGLLPVFGSSDIARGYWVIPLLSNAPPAPPPFQARVDAYSSACIAEAVVQILRKADVAELKALLDNRRSRFTQIVQDGKPYWIFLTFQLDSKSPKSPAKLAAVYVYNSAPNWNSQPLEIIAVAQRGADGRWRPQTGYFRRAAALTAANVLMESGCPARVVFNPVTEPPLEDFIDIATVPANELVDYINWSNGALLLVKNATLPALVAEKSKDELIQLVTRLEQTVLDLSSKAEVAKDQAQQIIENKGDPTGARALSIAYQQRIGVFRPIVAAIKQGIVQKQ